MTEFWLIFRMKKYHPGFASTLIYYLASFLSECWLFKEIKMNFFYLDLLWLAIEIS